MSEINLNAFWKLVNTARKSHLNGVSAIERPDKVVVYKLEEVLQVWADHFLRIGTPKSCENYDEEHYRNVSDFVANYNDLECDDDFLVRAFAYDEMQRTIKTLHMSKALGDDGITTEHLVYAGPVLVDFLCDLYNAVQVSEYIPKSFKRGVQVLLYKGKDICTLNADNYRGITLLPTYNKLFEILIWRRLKTW